ncbi:MULTISPECIES: NAD(P)/FAD-dependent oxidoreductase [Clostridium]|uniref:FAD-dependent oxidoreductase n=1 Tax=Clostridium cibarium TaxID=2762247 RepID=A0ABR8PRK2_9CLOT|nr:MULTISPECIES: NAD(P)/FAD-dependent oxidoreductase [Clostridium]MBD7910803.1 FAD-dependent oxidoreductase [Clostridium cibarium]
MLQVALKEAKHIEDFDSIIELLSPPMDITTIGVPGEFKGVKVGIIGGGLAGLCSAFELRKLGFDMTIFEMQKERIGGRVYTYYFDREKRYYGEVGAMRIPVSHETIWHYINLFKLKTRPFIQNNENAIIYVRNRRARNDSKGISVMENIYPEFELNTWERGTSWQELIEYALGTNLLKLNPMVRREILQVKEEYSPMIKYLGSFGVRRVFEEMGLSEGAIELISCVAPFLGSFYYNSYYENLQEDYTVDSAFRYELVGGSVNLPLAFYYSLISKRPKDYQNIEESNLGNVTWKNGKAVTGIYKNNDKIILEYRNQITSEISLEEFDFVICTIPFSSLRNVRVYPMFSNKKMQAIKEVKYVSSQKTAFMCSERFWEKGNAKEKIIGGGTYTDLSIGTIWYPGYHSVINSDNYNSYKEPGVLLASYNLEQDAIRLGNLEDRIRTEEIKRQVEAVHGLKRGYLDYVVENYKTVHWNEEEGFYGAFCYFMPEQQAEFSYSMSTPEYNNRVYFAGEHTSLTHGWMQGALNSGMKAANSLVEYCKVIK